MNSPSELLTTWGGGQPQHELIIKMHPADFDRANALLEKVALENISNIDPGHYLFKFTDEELIEILQKPDEWSKEDYLMAQKILAGRGKKYSKEQLNSLAKQRLERLGTPEGGQTGWIIVGYLSAVFGGLLGIFIGWHLLNFKKTLPNGERVFAYSKQVQKQGQIIFVLGLTSLIGWIIYKVLTMS